MKNITEYEFYEKSQLSIAWAKASELNEKKDGWHYHAFLNNNNVAEIWRRKIKKGKGTESF